MPRSSRDVLLQLYYTAVKSVKFLFDLWTTDTLLLLLLLLLCCCCCQLKSKSSRGISGGTYPQGELSYPNVLLIILYPTLALSINQPCVPDTVS